MGKDHFEGDKRVKFIEPEKIEQPKEKIVSIITPEEKEQQIKEEQESISLLATTNNGKHKMLVIEDHKDIRLYLKVLFSSEYTIVMAENGEEGVKMARHELPDIILTDIMMPVMDGFEATRILKEDLKTCHIPIIHLTALTGDTNAVKGLEYGADDYILKPFNAEILRSKVRRLIENRLNLKKAYMKLMMTSSISESDKQENEEQKEDPFIKQIFEIVEKNLQNPEFSVKRLAEMLNMSQPTLYRRVKMLTNYTIIELIRGVRLRNAASLLRTKKYSIQEVSEMVGYNDIPTFRKHFVDFYGVTPSQFTKEEESSEKKKMG
jgi:YesN/AraC family two-component response regulator